MSSPLEVESDWTPGAPSTHSPATRERAVRLAGNRVLAAHSSSARRSWPNRVRASVTAMLGFFDEQPELARTRVVNGLQADPETLARRSEVLDQLARVLDEEGRRASEAGEHLPPLLAEVVVGGVLSVIHSRLLHSERTPLMEILNPLMFVIVLPYQGLAAARGELLISVRPHPRGRPTDMDARCNARGMRLGPRMLKALAAIASAPGISNREVAVAAEIKDEGQISKLLSRVQSQGLVRNARRADLVGQPNAWVLTPQGEEAWARSRTRERAYSPVRRAHA